MAAGLGARGRAGAGANVGAAALAGLEPPRPAQTTAARAAPIMNPSRGVAKPAVCLLSPGPIPGPVPVSVPRSDPFLNSRSPGH